MKHRIPLALLLLLASALVCPAAPDVKPVPELKIETLFGSPTAARMRFSPSGRYLALLQPWERRMNLMVLDTKTLVKTQVTAMKEQDIADYLWVSDDRLIFGYDEDGKESLSLVSVKPDGTDARALGLYGGFAISTRLRDDPDHILVLSRGRQAARRDVSKMDVRTGRMRIVARNPGDITRWYPYRDGTVNLGVSSISGHTKILHRANADADWEAIGQFGDGQAGWLPLGFDGGPDKLFIVSRSEPDLRWEIYRYDLKTRTRGELVCADPVYDVDGLVYFDDGDRAVGVRYDAAKPKVVWLDPALAKIQTMVDSALPGTYNAILEASADGKRYLVRASSDRDPGVYYLLQPEARKLDELAVIYPAVDPAKMAPMKPVSFAARDGMTLYGYLTLPVGREPRGLPLVVHPHGGPYGVRDVWGYNPEVQFYANRGFAVLQLDYRGSGGYGARYEKAGYKLWGREMQDDLSDGVKWLIDQGIVDARRVVISGASYGGYAALAGLAFTPELYCAGVNYVGVADVEDLVKNPAFRLGEFAEPAWWRRTRIGDADAEGKRLRAISPRYHADKIKVPLLMAYGENDPRVPISQGEEMRAALKRAGRVEGKDFLWIKERNEGHGFQKEEKRIEFYQHVDAFLKQVVPPASPAG